MHAFEYAFGRWVVRHRWIILIGSLLLVALIVSGTRFLTFQNDNRIFFSDENPQLQAFEAMERVYAKNENVMFVLTPGDGKVFTRKTLAAIEDLTDKAWQIPFSSRVDSITNFQHTYAEGDDLIVEDMVSEAESLNDDALAAIRKTVLQEPLLTNRLINPQASVTAINVTIQKQDKANDEVIRIAADAREMATAFRAEYPDIELHLGGGVMFNNAFMEVSMEDMRTLVPFMYLALVVVMLYLLRSFTGTLATILVIGISMAGAMGLAGWAGIALSPPSVNSPTIILTLTIAHCIHLLTTQFDQMRHGKSKHDAIAESLRVNLQPIVLASITTAIGFLTLNFSDAPPFRDLGNIVAMGGLAAMAFSLITLPALMAVLPVRVPRQTVSPGSAFMERFGAFVVKHSRHLGLATLALVIFCLAGLQYIFLDDNFIEYFDERYEIRQSADYTQQYLTGLDTIEYSLQADGPGGINDPAYLERLDAFANWFREQPKVAHVSVLTDIVKRLNRNMHGDDPSYYRLPDDRELTAQYLLLYEMSLPYGLDLNNQINIDKSATRLVVVMNNATARELRDTDKQARKWLAANAPEHMFAYGASLSLMFAHISERNIQSMLGGTFIALALISGILLFALRSIRIGLISLVPNLLPAAMALGIWGYLVGQIGLSIAIVGSLSLGIVVDDTVHFLSKYLRARRELGYSPEQGVRYAFTSVGRALFTTTVILTAGFATLAFSGFKLNADTGMLTAIAIAIALVADFFLLPGMLLWFDRRQITPAGGVTATAVSHKA